MSQNLQEAHYQEDTDYWVGSPHLKHQRLHHWLLGLVGEEIETAEQANPNGGILEVGGGDGTITVSLLAMGYRVTSTDMSEASVSRMTRRFQHNDRFESVYDPTGDLEVLGEKRYSAIIYASVLHHIPDYFEAIRESTRRHLLPGGSFISFQDPLWYARQPAMTNRFSSAAFLSWRITQGELLTGIKSRIRRSTTGPDENNTRDSVEYHVIREGVDEQGIEPALEKDFDSVRRADYWSSQGTPQQALGEKLGMTNTFAMFASGFHGSEASGSDGDEAPGPDSNE